MKFKTFMGIKSTILGMFVFSLAADDIGLYERIAPENLKSLYADCESFSQDFKSYSDYLDWSFKNLIKDRPVGRRHAVFALFNGYEKMHPIRQTQVLDFTTWTDLNLLSGPCSNCAVYLGSKIKKTSTEFGKIALMGMIVQPTTDVTELENRQAIVKELVTNNELFENLSSSFNDLQKSETLLLSYWQSDPFSGAAKQKEIRFPEQPNFVEELNKNVFVNEFNERFDQVSQVVKSGSFTACVIAAPTLIWLMWTKKKIKLPFKEEPIDAASLETFAKDHLGLTTAASMMSAFGFASWLGNWGVKKITKSASLNNISQTVNRYASTVTYATGAYYSVDGMKASVKIMKALQTKLIAVSHFVRAFTDFYELIKQNPVLQQKLPATKKLHHVLNEVAATSKDFKKLLELLVSETFKGEASFFSHAGRIITANKLMEEQKGHLSEALVALGEIDAYLSIARLYKEGQGKDASWCFATYEKDSTTPFIESENFWNPFLDPKSVVVNSITMGTPTSPVYLLLLVPMREVNLPS